MLCTLKAWESEEFCEKKLKRPALGAVHRDVRPIDPGSALREQEDGGVGIGIGLKRLFGTGSGYDDLAFIPTIRLVNIGFAF